ncbi:MAG: retroviral-like aspartic protease family protein [Saprospiraceae bacterium]
MGIIRTNIELFNAADLDLFRRKKMSAKDVKKISVMALVDTGAYMLAINENIRRQLDLSVTDHQFAEIATGEVIELEVVGPIEIRFENRRTVTEAVVLPGNDTEVLLGAIPMEAMDVVIDMKLQELKVNPLHPTRPQLSLK